MCHKLLRDARFLAFLLRIDQDIGERTRLAGCRICGGVLHGAAYPRKPRGGPAELDPKFDRRLSFCCAKRDCRRRTTPPSVRFLGRRVYLGAVVVVISAMLHGVTPPRLLSGWRERPPPLPSATAATTIQSAAASTRFQVRCPAVDCG